MAEGELADEDPAQSYDYYLRDHPIHGQGWIDENGFRNVNNYAHKFIAAEMAPPHVWPVNAVDWGLLEVLPLHTQLQPEPNMGHVMLKVKVDEAQLRVCRWTVHPAFQYK
jgi:hypothetical protein